MENWGPAVVMLPFMPFDADDSGIDSDGERHDCMPIIGHSPTGSDGPDDGGDDDFSEEEFGHAFLNIPRPWKQIPGICSEDEADRFRQNLRKFCDPDKFRSSSDEDCYSPKKKVDFLKQSLLSRDHSLSDMDRESPPLLEVELTASDEEDDGSVLELVIPMQQNIRYQRARNPRGKREVGLFWNIWKVFCCLIPRIN